MANDNPTPAPKTPTDLLAEQAWHLSEISHVQQEQIRLLQLQNDQLSNILLQLSNIVKMLSARQPSSSPTQVRIADFNMPFLSLVGILIKVALASIPAAIIIGTCYLVMLLVFGGVFGTLLRR